MAPYRHAHLSFMKLAGDKLARAVDGDNHPASVGRTIRCQKGGHVGYFAGVGGAPERQVFQQFAVAVFIAKFIPGASFH